MKKNKLNFLFFFFTAFLILSCNSKEDDLIGKTWKLKSYRIEIKNNGKFEKIDSVIGVGLLFDEIKFINNSEFSFTSKGIRNDKKDLTLLGGTGFYKQTADKLALEFHMQKKSLSYKVNQNQFTIVEDVHFEPNEPMTFISKNNTELKITEARYICVYVR